MTTQKIADAIMAVFEDYTVPVSRRRDAVEKLLDVHTKYVLASAVRDLEATNDPLPLDAKKAYIELYKANPLLKMLIENAEMRRVPIPKVE